MRGAGPAARWVVGLAMALGALPGRVGRADLLSGEDRLRLLYSNRFVFDRRGVPMMRVRIMEGQARVVVKLASGVRVLPTGTGGPELFGGRSWEIRARRTRPAVIRYWTVLERRVSVSGTWGAGKVAEWKRRGLRVGIFELGTVFAVSGHVVDNRVALVAAEPRSSLADAQAVAAGLKRKHKIDGGVHAELVRRSDGLLEARELGSRFKVQSQGAIWFQPEGASPLTVEKVEYGRGYSWHGFSDRKYWGLIYVAVDRNGKLAVVNAVPADKLLMGLVPAEIFPSAHPEALKAQAVAARGQLYAKIGTRHLADPYLLCASQHCQVYSGAGKEHPRTTHAVKTTRGQVLLAPSGRLADTVYHAESGGHTEHNENVWGTRPLKHLRGRFDGVGRGGRWHRLLASGGVGPHVREWLQRPPRTYGGQGGRGRKVFRWRVKRSVEELSRWASSLGVGRVNGIEVVRRGISGRALVVRVRGAAGSTLVSGELRIRRLFGNLKSSMFVVDPVRGPGQGITGFTFVGGGWGHGVGMSQMGAIARAGSGQKLAQILGFYYPGTKLVRLY